MVKFLIKTVFKPTGRQTNAQETSRDFDIIFIYNKRNKSLEEQSI